MSVDLHLQNIPPEVQEALRIRAEAEKKTISQVALDVLAVGLGIAVIPQKKRDLSDIAGTWVDDPIFDELREYHDHEP